MAFCKYCGKPLADQDKFCGSCGKAVKEFKTVLESKTAYKDELPVKIKGEETDLYSKEKCPACGFEFQGKRYGGSVIDFVAKLESIEEKKSAWRLSKGRTEGGEETPFEKEETTLIINFLIPNTKEDVREFIILAASNVVRKGKLKYKEEEVISAWEAKIKQAYTKAKILFRNDPEFKDIKMIYFDTMVKPKIKNATIIVGVFLFIIGLHLCL